MALTPGEVEDLVLYQVAAVAGMARAEGVRVAHVKPHGALYNQAARDPSLAAAIARAVARIRCWCSWAWRSRWSMPRAAAGLQVRSRGLRRSRVSGRRLARTAGPGGRGHRCLRSLPPAPLASCGTGWVRSTRRQREIPLRADTLCIHGDTPGAPGLARAVRAALEAAGVRVAAPEG